MRSHRTPKPSPRFYSEFFVQAGVISDAATLGTYFSSASIGALTDIPLKDLATYTSGLPSDNQTVTDLPNPVPSQYSDSQMFSFLGGTPPPPFFSQLNSPGVSYSYSNLGFALLAQAVARASSGSDNYKQLLQNYILDPLQLNNTELFSSFNRSLPMGFDQQMRFTPQNELQKKAGPGWIVLPAYNGAGGLVSTPQDMLTWLQFNMGITYQPMLSNLLPQLQSRATDVTWGNGNQLGLGWVLAKIEDRQSNAINVVFKDGELRGFTSFVAFLQTAPGVPSDAGVFVLTNSQGDAVYNIAYDLLFIMSGLEPPPDKERYPRIQRSAASLR